MFRNRGACGIVVPTMKTLLAASLLAALPVLAACGGDDTTAQDPSTTSPSSPTTTGPGTYPSFAPQDYTYRLEVLCFCPMPGPAEVTVSGGEVVSAVLLRGGHGMAKGSEAPEYMERTINDVIDSANDPEADKVKVDWPDGQDYPSSVSVDQNERAMDDEVTYVVKDVSVSGG